MGFPGSSDGKESARSEGGPGSIPESGRFPGERMAPTPVFSPGEPHGQRSLLGYSPWGCKESDTTERRALTSQSYGYFYFWLLMRCFKIVSRLLFYFYFSFISSPPQHLHLLSVEISRNDTKPGVIDWSSKCWDSFKVTVWLWLGHSTSLASISSSA